MLIAVLPALGLAIYDGRERRQGAVAAAHAEALTLARRAAAREERLIEGARHFLGALTWLPELRGQDGSACRAIFTALGTRFPAYANLLASRADGEVFCSALPLRGPQTLATFGGFRRALETREFAVGDYFIGPPARRPVLQLAHPVVDRDGSVRTVVSAPLDLGWLNRFAAEVRVPPGVTVAIVDGAGMILARHPEPERWVGTSVAALPLFARIQGRAGEYTDRSPGADGVDRFFAFKTLQPSTAGGHVSLKVGIPAAVALAEADRLASPDPVVPRPGGGPMGWGRGT